MKDGELEKNLQKLVAYERAHREIIERAKAQHHISPIFAGLNIALNVIGEELVKESTNE